ncbi:MULTISPECIES: hypothetical protein [unclassified Arcicella]|nr:MULTISPECIES: hypothetical protein [unclassified Arcicella]MDR6563989.1 hypothetical protein [Arcicella sp. BE51]MDR6813742.1 hypothetical protein [Arcicella sp. BE140]MDR6825054.1 hypothetical protein [Arcicella sp. BE139]
MISKAGLRTQKLTASANLTENPHKRLQINALIANLPKANSKNKNMQV